MAVAALGVVRALTTLARPRWPLPATLKSDLPTRLPGEKSARWGIQSPVFAAPAA